MDTKEYLKRINCKKAHPSPLYLHQLIRSHRLCIPYENLDFYYQKESLLSTKDIFRKLILKKRGGYHIELNWLFAALLINLGFEVRYLKARRYDEEQEKFLEKNDYLLLRVFFENDQSFLVDVGMISGWSKAMLFDSQSPQLIDNEYYKLEQGEGKYLIKRSKDASLFFSWLNVVSTYVKPIEFLQSHQEYQQTESTLKNNRFLYRKTNFGYKYIENHIFIVEEKGEVVETNIDNEAAFWSLVEQHFHISEDVVQASK